MTDVVFSSVEASRDEEPYPVSWYGDDSVVVVAEPDVSELDWLAENGDDHGSGEFERFAKGSAKGFASRMWREGARRSSKLSMCDDDFHELMRDQVSYVYNLQNIKIQSRTEKGACYLL
jgi:hypothetical protein